MRISIEASEADIEPAVNWISGFIGAVVDKRVSAFEQQERRNPLLTKHFSENYDLEFALAKARRHRKTTGRLPKGGAYDSLYGFLIAAHRIHQALPAAVKAPFEGRLRNAVSSAYGFRPFAYEISIATHLMQKGWDVDFADYSGAARFDFLARQGAVEIEVECKSTSGDTGRKIHRQEVNRLADLLLPSTTKLVDVKGCHLRQIIIPDRLGKSNHELTSIATAASIVARERVSASCEFAQVDYAFEGLTSWPAPDRDPNAQDFFEDKFGIKNSHMLFHGRGDFSVVVVIIKSSKPDNVVDTIGDEAKEAAEQCSGGRPALIALHLIDPISRSELQTMLKTSSGLHAIARAVFNATKRLHVDSVAFTVPQVVWADGFGAKQLSGDVVVLNNPAPKFPCEELRSIFRS
jgi:Holliday junction resolvase